MFSWPKFLRLGFFVAILLAASLLALHAQEQKKLDQKKFLVVSVVGDWHYQGQRVQFGQSLASAAGACLTASDGSIVLRGYDAGGSLHPFACEKAFRQPDCSGADGNRCAVPLTPEKWKPAGDIS